MIWAVVAAMLGVGVWFAPAPARPIVMVACLACGLLYVRAMSRRAREDAQ